MQEFGWINVKDPHGNTNGAKGDGVTDDTAAIQDAIDAGKGGTIFFPPSVYRCTDTLSIPGQTRLLGSSCSAWHAIGRQRTVRPHCAIDMKNGTILRFDGDASGVSSVDTVIEHSW